MHVIYAYNIYILMVKKIKKDIKNQVLNGVVCRGGTGRRELVIFYKGGENKKRR